MPPINLIEADATFVYPGRIKSWRRVDSSRKVRGVPPNCFREQLVTGCMALEISVAKRPEVRRRNPRDFVWNQLSIMSEDRKDQLAFREPAETDVHQIEFAEAPVTIEIIARKYW